MLAKVCFMLIHKIKEDEYQDDINGRMRCIKYKIFVKNVEKVLDVLEGWRIPGNFDDLAFRNARGDKLQVKIREVKRQTENSHLN